MDIYISAFLFTVKTNLLPQKADFKLSELQKSAVDFSHGLDFGTIKLAWSNQELFKK